MYCRFNVVFFQILVYAVLQQIIFILYRNVVPVRSCGNLPRNVQLLVDRPALYRGLDPAQLFPQKWMHFLKINQLVPPKNEGHEINVLS